MINSNTSIFVPDYKHTCQRNYKNICIISCMEKFKTYGERLKWALKQAKMSQSKLAEELKNVRPQAIQHLCDPKKAAQGSIHTARIARILKISALWLEANEGSPFFKENSIEIEA